MAGNRGKTVLPLEFSTLWSSCQFLGDQTHGLCLAEHQNSRYNADVPGWDIGCHLSLSGRAGLELCQLRVLKFSLFAGRIRNRVDSGEHLHMHPKFCVGPHKTQMHHRL